VTPAHWLFVACVLAATVFACSALLLTRVWPVYVAGALYAVGITTYFLHRVGVVS
jgi:hypothetical protein